MATTPLHRVLDLIDRCVRQALADRNSGPLISHRTDIKNAITHDLNPEEARTARAYYRTRARQLAAYLEDPHPYGESRLDVAASNTYVANGVLTGQSLARLSEIPSHVRDALQHCKSAGGALTEPHVVSRDRSIPLFLEPFRLMRQFDCPAWAALDLQQCFIALEADQRLVADYADRAKQSGLDAVLLELNYYASQLTQLEQTGTDFYSPHCVCRHDPDQHRDSGLCSALSCKCTRYCEAQQLPYNDTDPDPDDEAHWLGSYEPVAYHKIASNADPKPPATTHPWIKRFTGATREQLPRLRQQAFAAMKQEKWPSRIAGAVWNNANIQLIRKARPAYRHLLDQIERAATPAELARLGTTAYRRQTTWTTSERAYFWRAYTARKATLAGADPDAVTSHAPVHELGIVGKLPSGEYVIQCSDHSLRAALCEPDPFYATLGEPDLQHITLTSRRPLSPVELRKALPPAVR